MNFDNRFTNLPKACGFDVNMASATAKVEHLHYIAVYIPLYIASKLCPMLRCLRTWGALTTIRKSVRFDVNLRVHMCMCAGVYNVHVRTCVHVCVSVCVYVYVLACICVLDVCMRVTRCRLFALQD